MENIKKPGNNTPECCFFENLPRQFAGFHFASDLSLPSIRGCGVEYIDSHSYHWENRGRNHPICLIQYCISGEGEFESGGTRYPVLPGDAFIAHIPGESSYCLPEHSDEWEILFLEFTPDCIPYVQKLHRICGPVIHLSEESGFPARFLKIYQSALTNGYPTIFENSKTAFNLWIDLIAYALEAFPVKPTKIDDVKTYLEQHFSNPNLSLDSIADNTGMSKYHMCREFQKKYGTSPGNFVKNLRLTQACRLLTLNQDYTLSDIARMTGYSNNNYFGKVFKAAKGISPERFRRESIHYDFVRTIPELPQK